MPAFAIIIFLAFSAFTGCNPGGIPPENKPVREPAGPETNHNEPIGGEENRNNREETRSEPTPETVTVTLYLADREAINNGRTESYLAPVQRTCTYTRRVLNLALTELAKGPREDENHLCPVMPATSCILGINIENGVATVNLSSEVLTDSPGGTLGGGIFIKAMILTCTEFPTVDSVQVLVEGENWCDGHVVWDRPLGRGDLNF